MRCETAWSDGPGVKFARASDLRAISFRRTWRHVGPIRGYEVWAASQPPSREMAEHWPDLPLDRVG